MRRTELNRLVDDFLKSHGEFGLERIDASEIEFGRLLENVSSTPFLTEKRMIILSNASANKALSEHIEQLLDSVSESTDLILDEQKFDKRLLLYKTLKKRTEIREFLELDERSLSAWLVQEAKNRGGELKANDAAYLVSRAGLNQLSLSNELDKLLSYETNITRFSIDELVEPLPSSTMFSLLDAAFAGDRKRTLDLYEDQRKQQVEPQAIMGMIAWQLHIIALVKYNEGDSVDRVAAKSKLNPFVVRKTLGMVRNLQLSQVKDMVGRALQLDSRLKTESINADDAVQHFLLTI